MPKVGLAYSRVTEAGEHNAEWYDFLGPSFGFDFEKGHFSMGLKGEYSIVSSKVEYEERDKYNHVTHDWEYTHKTYDYFPFIFNIVLGYKF